MVEIKHSLQPKKMMSYEDLNIAKQNIQNNKKEIMNRRYLVGTNNCFLKKFERISLKKDHSISIFMQWMSKFMSFNYISNLKIMSEKYEINLKNINIEI